MTIPWTPFFTVVNILQDHYGFFLKPDKLCTTKTLESITGGKLNNDAFVVTMNSVSTLKCFGGNCDATPSGAPFMNCEIEFLRRRGWNRQKHIYSSDNLQIANCTRMVGSNSSNCSNLHQGNIGWDIEPHMEMNTSLYCPDWMWLLLTAISKPANDNILQIVWKLMSAGCFLKFFFSVFFWVRHKLNFVDFTFLSSLFNSNICHLRYNKIPSN